MTSVTSLEITAAHRDPAWDEFVAAVPGGDHVQTSAWAQTKRASGLEAVRVVAASDESIVGGAQILIRRLPLVGSFGYVPRGPVVAQGDAATASAVTEGLRRVARDRHIRHLVIQPARNDDWLADRLPAWGFSPSALSVAPTATVVVDLSPERDELLSAMSKTTRRHIRRAERAGVSVRRGSTDDLPAFHSLLSMSASRHGFEIYSLEYFKAMWEAMDTAGSIALYLAELDAEAISAQLVVPFGDIFLSKVAAWSGKHRDKYPNELLEWHLISAAKDAGFRYYDFEGFDRTSAERLRRGDAAPPNRSVDSFKMKFGGSVILLPKAFDYFANPLLRHTYGRAYGLLTSGGWPNEVVDRLRIPRSEGGGRGG